MVRYKNRYGIFRVRLEGENGDDMMRKSLSSRDIYYALQVRNESFSSLVSTLVT